MRIYVMIFVILLTLMTTAASSATVEAVEDWNVTFDGGNDEIANSVQQTSDEGYILVGSTNDSVDNDMWLVKTDSTGSEVWNLTFNCNVSDDDITYSVQQTNDSGYIVAGTTETGTDRDMLLVKINSTGSEDWNVTFDGSYGDYARYVQQTDDDGYIIAGYTNNSVSWDMWLVKTNSTGSEVWNVTFDSDYNDYARSVQQTDDDGYIVAGYTNNSASWDMWLVKTNSTGSEVWNVTFDGGIYDNEANSVQQTLDDGYIVAGYTENTENRDMWLVKTNPNGSEVWNVNFDGGVGHDIAYSVQQTDDGYIVAGYTNNSVNRDMWLVKVKENHAPVLDTIGDKSVNENNPLTFTVSATDFDNDTLVYSGTNLPTGATLNNSTGAFSWTPSGSQSGDYSIDFTVSDGSLNDSEIISITVNNVRTGGSSSGGGSGSGSSGEAFENIAFKDVKTENIVDGLEISYVFDEEQNAIQYVNFSALRNYGRVSTTIEVLEKRSSMVDESAPGLVYSNLNIWVGRSGFATESNIAHPVIGFSVSKAWLTENGIDENSIALYRHSEGKWNALDIQKVGDDDDSYIYFEAKTPGFSPFAIAAEVDDEILTDNTTSEEEFSNSVNDTEPIEEELPVTESNSIPGISIFTSVFVLVFACLFRKRKN
ncbi:PGF-pre-PGF domain-containing protein [Methanococcoides alaskense]|uniref:PGF-pre-PGF domain-containing protein n=1 Tax=Methanococcoides alaskense TaxID=325778 RepID=A0AA90Z9B4_9EURY|nr:PGF-pre-PGF domain-containing protein [Methanococcoides alaskense]MDR6223369.1 PGF-pre-PGF domain-containing protein [Methanococcoides alaskense]